MTYIFIFSDSGQSNYFICFITEQKVCFQIPLLRIKMQKQNDIKKIFSFGLHFSSLHFLVWHSSNMWYVLNNWNCDSYRYTKIGNQYNHTKNTNNTTLVGIVTLILKNPAPQSYYYRFESMNDAIQSLEDYQFSVQECMLWEKKSIPRMVFL